MQSIHFNLLSFFLWFLPPLIKVVNLQGSGTVQVGWPSAAQPWAQRRQSEGVGLSPGPWTGAQRMCPSRLRETCRGRRWCRRMGRTNLEGGWKASLVEQSLTKKRGKESRRRGERKRTCYDFDGAMLAAGQVSMMEERGINMKNKHKEMKIQNTKKSKTPQTGTQNLKVKSAANKFDYMMQKLKQMYKYIQILSDIIAKC